MAEDVGAVWVRVTPLDALRSKAIALPVGVTTVVTVVPSFFAPEAATWAEIEPVLVMVFNVPEVSSTAMASPVSPASPMRTAEMPPLLVRLARLAPAPMTRPRASPVTPEPV